MNKNNLNKTNYSFYNSIALCGLILLLGANYMDDQVQNLRLNAHSALDDAIIERVNSDREYQHEVNIINLRILGRIADVDVDKMLKDANVTK